MELTDEMIKQLKADLSGATIYSNLMGKDGAMKNRFDELKIRL